MNITGFSLIAADAVEGTGTAFRGVNPVTLQQLDPPFRESGSEQIGRAVDRAAEAFPAFAAIDRNGRARFLRAIAGALLDLGDTLISRAGDETALPASRLEGERGRTVNQLRLLADVIEEGSWVEARIDPGDPSREPVRKPDVRRMLVPLGPVAVFGASNFPLAFSVPGGDTASALAAGCTIVCKAHPAHPGTSELAAHAIRAAARDTGMPAGVFSLVHGWSHEVGLSLVRHPSIAAVGFTGSLRGGRAIFDAAAARPVPIPVYAEMGSINPVFLLPSAIEERGDAIAQELAQSITQGVGQFCTNPGVVLGIHDTGFERFAESLADRIRGIAPGVMLYERLAEAFANSVDGSLAHGATLLGASSAASAAGMLRARPTILRLDIDRFVGDASHRQEMFGPASTVVTADDAAGLERAAEALEGQLTATIHGTPEDLAAHSRLVGILQRKVGRLVFNGVPTGVEVGHAMQHGGPYPASTDARSTSVGSAALTRFARPVCFQDFPQVALPAELRDRNELGIWRLVDGKPTRDDI